MSDRHLIKPYNTKKYKGALGEVATLSGTVDSVFVDVLDYIGNISGGGGGGTAVAGVSAGLFVTDITCGGITTKAEDGDSVTVGTKIPVLSALVDDDQLTFTLVWNGLPDEWTGYPSISGHQVDKDADNVAAISASSRWFTATKTIDYNGYAGQVVTIPITLRDGYKTIDVEFAGAPPEVTNVTFGDFPTYGSSQQDHFKDGDDIEVTLEFDQADVSTITLAGGNDTATNNVNNLNVTVNSLSATVTVECGTTLSSIQSRPIKVTAKNAMGTAGGEFTSSTTPVLDGPVITNVTFGDYPGVQTELKTGDQVEAVFEFDTNKVNRVQTYKSGNSYASSNQTLNVTTANLSATTNITIDANNRVSAANKPIKVESRFNGHHGSNGADFQSVNTLNINDEKPTFSSPSTTYNNAFQALKSGDDADVTITVSDQGANATYTYTTYSNQLTITSPNDYQAGAAKTVQYNSGDYNISTNNYILTVNRAENDKSATVNTTVKIANTDPEITITEPSSRLRSKGSPGQDYNIGVSSNQQLIGNIQVSAPHGTITNNSGGPTSWTMSLKVIDTDAKGIHNWGIASGTTNLAGKGIDANNIKTTAGQNNSYELGGFLAKTLNLSPLTRTVALGTNISDSGKLANVTETFRGGISLSTTYTTGTTLDPDLNSGEDEANKYTIVDSGSPTVVDLIDGNMFFYLDKAAASANTTGSIVNIEETV
jgi:hypothetical protein